MVKERTEKDNMLNLNETISVIGCIICIWAFMGRFLSGGGTDWLLLVIAILLAILLVRSGDKK